jgi:4-diphosphocytidyl-2-C-methyl-D-erythritol kinase
MGEAFDREVAYHIHIEKRIPHKAGLGGGSSNAATVIRALAHEWGIALDDSRIAEVARSIGSDVAVFLAPTACSRMTGYGDVLAESFPARTGQPLVIVMAPDVSASTPEVYRMFDSMDVDTVGADAICPDVDVIDSDAIYPEVDPIGSDTISPSEESLSTDAICSDTDTETISAYIEDFMLVNDLRDAAIAVCPEIGEVLEWLSQHAGSEKTQVTGSGAACYALADTIQDAEDIVRRACGRGFWAVATALR